MENPFKSKAVQTVELGDLAKDRITGFTGVVECVSHWLNCCRRITIRPTTLKDGVPLDNRTFDEPQIELVEKGYFNKPIIPVNQKTGGISISPEERKDPI